MPGDHQEGAGKTTKTTEKTQENPHKVETEQLKRLPTQRFVTNKARKKETADSNMDVDPAAAAVRRVRATTSARTEESKLTAAVRRLKQKRRTETAKNVDSLSELFKNATIGDPMREGGKKKRRYKKKSQKGGEVEGALAKEVASQPAPLEGGKKKSQKGGSCCCSEPMTGGKKKTTRRRKQKGGEVEGALAKEVASQPALAELLGEMKI